MSKEKRKYPRFDVNLEVIFYDKRRTKGKLINISKKGCLLTTDSGLMRTVGSMITFRVFFSGKTYLSEGTVPQISMRAVTKTTGPVESANDQYPNAVKIIGKVARHVKYQDQLAMGIVLHELDGNDLVKWNSYLAQVGKEQVVLPYSGPDEVTLPKADPPTSTVTNIYTIRFKTLQHAIRYLPTDPKGLFFLPSKTLRKKGDLIKISMIHPENQSELSFNAKVEAYGLNPKNESTIGVFFRYENLSIELKKQINKFLGTNHFE